MEQAKLESNFLKLKGREIFSVYIMHKGSDNGHKVAIITFTDGSVLECNITFSKIVLEPDNDYTTSDIDRPN